MTQTFRQAVTELWRLAELGAPRFASDGSTSLYFDDVALTFTTSPNEQELLVVADVGPISNRLAADTDRLQKILGLSFALLASHNVLVSRHDDQLIVSGSYPFHRQDVTLLSDLMSDVVSAAQTLNGQMDHVDTPRAQNAGSIQSDPETMIIFQP